MACFAHRSLSAAGLVEHRGQSGASQVPLALPGTFQSHSRVARRPHRQRFVLEHTIARPPPGNVTVSQVTPRDPS